MNYEEKRAALMKEVETLKAQKKIDGMNAKMDEIEALDAAHEKEMLAAATEKANEAAMRQQKLANPMKMNVQLGTGGKVEETMENKENKAYTADSPEYRNAFLHKLQGTMTEADNMVMAGITTTQAGDAIPTSTVNKIIEQMVKLAPMIGEIDLQNIPGYVKFPLEDTVNDAEIHTENAAITAAADTVTYVSLGGYEIVKLLQISATVKAMTVDAFESWIVSNLSRKLAEAIENYIINGTGSSQPKGINAMYASWTDGTNAVDWANGTTLADADVTEAISYLPARCYGNAKFLLNPKTLWQKVMPIRDDSKYKIVTELPGGKYAIHGYPVLLSDKVADNVLFFGDFHAGVKGNFADPIKIAANESAGFNSNSTMYRGACLYDNTTVPGNVVKCAASL